MGRKPSGVGLCVCKLIRVHYDNQGILQGKIERCKCPRALKRRCAWKQRTGSFRNHRRGCGNNCCLPGSDIYFQKVSLNKKNKTRKGKYEQEAKKRSYFPFLDLFFLLSETF